MTVAKRKGAQGKADRLAALLVKDRAGFRCEARLAHDQGQIDWHPECHNGPTHWAHFIGRKKSAHLRTALDNAACLCATAHADIDSFAHHKIELAEAIYGAGHYDDLYRRQRETLRQKFDWEARAETLERLAHERGLL